MHFCVTAPRFLTSSRLVSLAAVSAILLTVAPPQAFAGPYEMGLKLYQQGNYALAVRYFKQATAENGGNPNMHYYLADSLMKTNRISEAQAEYQKILALAPDSQAARLSRIGLSRLRDHVDAAQKASWSRGGMGGSRNGTDVIRGLPIGSDNYLEEINESGRFVRWSLNRMPIKVYIERAPQGIRNFEPGFVNEVRRGMDVWVNALGHQISYEIVSNANSADIRVTWVNNIDTVGHSTDGGTSYTAGIAVPDIRQNQLYAMNVKIATFDIENKPQSSQNIYAVAIHELGHAMGLLGHSEDPGDIMYAENKEVISPSKRDLNTIRELYSKPADITNQPPGSEEIDPERQKEIAARSDQTITKLEKDAKEQGAALTWLNLGVAYFQKGKRLQKEDSTGPGESDPRYWFDKAMTATNEALKREPNDPRAYHKRSLVHQALEDIPGALRDIDKAIQLDRKEAEYYMLKSWYHAKLGQKAQSRSALDTYLLMRPDEAGSAEVKDILNLIGSR